MKNDEIDVKFKQLEDEEKEQKITSIHNFSTVSPNKSFPSYSADQNLSFGKQENFLKKILFLILMIFVTSLFLYLLIRVSGEMKVYFISDSITKSNIDRNKYSIVRFRNNLQSLIISDPSAETCAVAVSADVGSFQDGKIPGLAHFCEHMLFLGSKTFPKYEDFEKHLAKHNGYSNAYTSEEKTVYYFEIGCDGLSNATEIFSQMFIEPLFDPTYISKELNAIYSEHEKNLSDDLRKLYQVVKQTSNPKHLFNSDFGTGSNLTLGMTSKEELMNSLKMLFSKFYFASNMRLLVYQKKDNNVCADEMEKLFNLIIDKDLKKLEEEMRKTNLFTETPFTRSELGKLVLYQTVSKGVKVDIIFSLESTIALYKIKPLEFFSFMIMNKQEGSLIALLKEKKYIQELTADYFNNQKSFSTYSVSMQLTTLGLNNFEEIINLVFSYIQHLKSELNSSLYNEFKEIKKVAFLYSEKPDQFGNYLGNLLENMYIYEPNDVMYGQYVVGDYDANALNLIYSKLIPENCNIYIGLNKVDDSSDFYKKFFFNRSDKNIENIYSTNYEIAPFNSSNISISVENLKYPFRPRKKNTFITNLTNYSSCLSEDDKFPCKEEAKVPQVQELEGLTIYWLYDHSFIIPKVNLHFKLYFHSIHSKVENFYPMILLKNYFAFILDRSIGEIENTSNEITLENDESGITIFLSVYSDLVPRISSEIIRVISENSFESGRFESLKEMTDIEIVKKRAEPPYKKLKELFKKVVTNHSFIKEELNDDEINISYEHFLEAVNEMRNSMYIDILVYGKFSQNTIDIIRENCEQKLKRKGVKKEDFRNYTHNKNLSGSFRVSTKNYLKSETNHLTANNYQVGELTALNLALINLLDIAYGNSFFSILRTEKQLGYVVHSLPASFGSVLYYIVLVQGTKLDPEQTDIEIDNTILNLSSDIRNISDLNFEELKQSYIKQIEVKASNLKEKSDKLFSKISNFNKNYDILKEVKELLPRLKAKDLISFHDKIFSSMLSKLSLHVWAGTSYKEFSQADNLPTILNPSIKTVATTDLNKIISEYYIPK